MSNRIKTGRSKKMATSRTLKCSFATAQGFLQALNLKNAKGRQQMRDAIEAQRALVTPWLEERSMPENPDAVRMEVMKAMRDATVEVTVEGSVYNYVRDAVQEAIDGGKLHHLMCEKVERAMCALEEAREAPVTALPKLLPKAESA